VDEALAYFYYPQFGNRSWGGAARRGIKGRDDRRTYAEWWNNCGVLWLQSESIAAITNPRHDFLDIYGGLSRPYLEGVRPS